ncbi:MAG: TPM domain-containing protein [Bacteroidales bacterium]|nr:TPM domain-containing protein [Bacteroidales bacterium]
MKQILSDNDRALLDKRIAETEQLTRAQIVVASVLCSDSYAEIPWKAFAFGVSIASLLCLLMNLFLLGWLRETLLLVSVVVILATGILAVLLTILFPGFTRLFLSSHRKETETRQYAESLFLSRELFSTHDRRGILLMASQFERQMVILPDKGVRDLLGVEVLSKLISNMKDQLRRRELRQAMETGLDGIRTALDSPVPGRTRTNELSDEIIEEEGL